MIEIQLHIDFLIASVFSALVTLRDNLRNRVFLHCSYRRPLCTFSFGLCTTMFALESGNKSVCVPWWHLVSLCSKPWQVSLSVSIALSSPCLRSPKMTSIDNAPLSFTTEVIVGFWNWPVCSWFLRTSTSTSPRISPCKSLRGKNAARQQEKDQCGFLRHSLMKRQRKRAYWTES